MNVVTIMFQKSFSNTVSIDIESLDNGTESLRYQLRGSYMICKI